MCGVAAYRGIDLATLLYGAYASNDSSAMLVNNLLSSTTGMGIADWYSVKSSSSAFTTELATLQVMDASALKTGESLTTLDGSLKELSDGASTLAGGINTLNNGAGSLNDGLSTLNDGGVALVSGIYDLSGGVSKLKNGSAALKDGTDQLNANSSKLNSGAADLVKGTEDLGSGAKSVQNGAKKLNTGAGDLTDGIAKFNDEGVSKISEAFDGDIQSFSDRLQAVNKASEDYTSFGGAASDQKSTVKFFFKTAGITTDEDSSNN